MLHKRVNLHSSIFKYSSSTLQLSSTSSHTSERHNVSVLKNLSDNPKPEPEILTNQLQLTPDQGSSNVSNATLRQRKNSTRARAKVSRKSSSGRATTGLRHTSSAWSPEQVNSPACRHAGLLSRSRTVSSPLSDRDSAATPAPGAEELGDTCRTGIVTSVTITSGFLEQ